ncbi:MAG: S-adenosyl-l-methionine hydroxide adenosyltransferase family protein [Erysipelotrichaceae bacterium]
MNKLLIYQSDFGLVDGAVSAMEGVALKVDLDLTIRHLTHEITPYNIFEASYRLYQTVVYWPSETVFVSVVDPGVGTKRRSVVAKTKDDKYIVTPNNGTLTHLAANIGIVEIREIDKNLYRKETNFSHTFHGRDVYSYTGALLASGKIQYEEVGKKLDLDEILCLPLSEVEVSENLVRGNIDILDVRFGSLWTNINREDFLKLNVKYGEKLEVTIYNGDTLVYQNQIVYGKSFAEVMVGSPIVYINSVFKVGIAINQGSFAKAYNIGVGSAWVVELRKAK